MCIFSPSWSAHPDNNNQGAPPLHDVFAKFYDQQNEYGLAQSHYLRGTFSKDYATMLIKWSSEGFPSERDLYIARAVLQYLCLSNLSDARTVYMCFKEAVKIQTPLINFLEFLLQTIEQKSADLFVKLRNIYTPSINRDDTFSRYLDIMAKNYFGLQPPQSSSGGMMKLLQAFMQNS